MRKYFPGIVGAASIAAAIVVWYHLDQLPIRTALPSLRVVWSTFVVMYADGYIHEDVPTSLVRWGIGVGIASVCGVLAGFLTGRIRTVGSTLGALLHALRALPAVALAPVFIRIAGIDEASKVVVIAFGAFFPVWLTTHHGTGLIPRVYNDVAAVYRLGWFSRLRNVYLPSTLPHIISGVRLGCATGYVMVFISEWIGANAGVGYRMAVADTLGHAEIMTVGLLTLAVLSVATDGLIYALSRVVWPWLRLL